MSDEIKKVDEVVDNPEPKPINNVYDVHGKMLYTAGGTL